MARALLPQASQAAPAKDVQITILSTMLADAGIGERSFSAPASIRWRWRNRARERGRR